MDAGRRRSARRWGGIALMLWVAAGAGCAHVVRVETTPPGASVTVNGRFVGRTPATFEEDLDPTVQEHVVVAQLNGYETSAVRLRRSELNPWIAFSALPLCGTLGWVGAAVSLFGGILLTAPTCGASALFGVPAFIVMGAAGCGWAVVTSPALLLLTRLQRLPEVVQLQLKASGTFDQHDTPANTWPPTYPWHSDDDGYWQNPAPAEDPAAMPPPTAPEAEPPSAGSASLPAASAPASQPQPPRTLRTPRPPLKN